MTVLVVDRLVVDGDRRADAQTLASHLVAAMRGAPGALWADAAWSLEDGDVLTIASEWRTAADADTFLASAEAAGLAERIDVLVREDPSRRRFESAAPGA